MQLPDAASAIARRGERQRHRRGEEPKYFVYYEWMGWRDIPEDVVHVKIHSSVRRIGNSAFWWRRQLRIVILNEELEEIGAAAFSCCESLQEILIHNAVRVIEAMAFAHCSGLTIVTLGDGLEKIELEAFLLCTSLERIIIPSAVKVMDCTSFSYCSRLTSVKFCDHIEEFVSREAMRDWWNQGVHKSSLSTYCFLVRCSIPKRFAGLAKISSWQANINGMLRSISTVFVHPDDTEDDIFYDVDQNAHFNSIDTKLTEYTNLLDAATTLFPEQIGLDDGTVLNILSFL
jgi:hypothetical protein